jgi:hypothetical protein
MIHWISCINQPRVREGGAADNVPKIWHDRFMSEMEIILQAFYKDDSAKAPFKANWRETPPLAN